MTKDATDHNTKKRVVLLIPVASFFQASWDVLCPAISLPQGLFFPIKCLMVKVIY